jgi:hypothetical protein
MKGLHVKGDPRDHGKRMPDGCIVLVCGLDIYGQDIRSYETRLQTEQGRDTVNPRIVRLWESLRDNGMRNPLICLRDEETGKTYVEMGNQRLACVRALGWDTVEIVMAESRADAKALYKDYV